MPIDPNNISFHVFQDGMNRYSFIRNSIGFGEPIVVLTEDKKVGGNATTTLTSTGVVVIRNAHNTIITTYIANMKQAKTIYFKATKNTMMPRSLWLAINYNNNTKEWKKVAA